MESSMNSMNKSLSSKAQTDYNSPEESSWTYYIQDFLYGDGDNHDEQYSCFSSGYETHTLLTDAASSAAKNPIAHNVARGFTCHTSKPNNQNSSLRMRKVKGRAAMDDDLEDTASSPVNSPKVSYMNQFQMEQKDKDLLDISERNISGRNGLAIDGGNSEITELKKRGLCLVPLSTFANYIT